MDRLSLYPSLPLFPLSRKLLRIFYSDPPPPSPFLPGPLNVIRCYDKWRNYHFQRYNMMYGQIIHKKAKYFLYNALFFSPLYTGVCGSENAITDSLSMGGAWECKFQVSSCFEGNIFLLILLFASFFFLLLKSIWRFSFNRDFWTFICLSCKDTHNEEGRGGGVKKMYIIPLYMHGEVRMKIHILVFLKLRSTCKISLWQILYDSVDNCV